MYVEETTACAELAAVWARESEANSRKEMHEQKLDTRLREARVARKVRAQDMAMMKGIGLAPSGRQDSNDNGKAWRLRMPQFANWRRERVIPRRYRGHQQHRIPDEDTGDACEEELIFVVLPVDVYVGRCCHSPASLSFERMVIVSLSPEILVKCRGLSLARSQHVCRGGVYVEILQVDWRLFVGVEWFSAERLRSLGSLYHQRDLREKFIRVSQVKKELVRKTDEQKLHRIYRVVRSKNRSEVRKELVRKSDKERFRRIYKMLRLKKFGPVKK